MRALLNLSKLNYPSKHKNKLIFTICSREKQAGNFSLTFKKKKKEAEKMKQVIRLLGASSKADPKFRGLLFWALSTPLTFYL